MSFIFVMVLRIRKRLTPKDIVAVKGLNMFGNEINKYTGHFGTFKFIVKSIKNSVTTIARPAVLEILVLMV
jgi:hypothetical protein